jgi:hypothetical protein
LLSAILCFLWKEQCLCDLFSRQIALKALSERLSKVEPQPASTVSWEQDRTKDSTGPSTSQTVTITIPPEETSAKPTVTSPAPGSQIITMEAELSKT